MLLMIIKGYELLWEKVRLECKLPLFLRSLCTSRKKKQQYFDLKNNKKQQQLIITQWTTI